MATDSSLTRRRSERAAFGLTLFALALALAVGVGWVVAMTAEPAPDATLNTTLVVTGGIVPAMLSLAALAALWSRSLLSTKAALVVSALTIAAWAIAALAAVSNALAWKAADEDAPLTGLAAWWLPLFSIGSVIGGVAIVVVTAQLVARTSVSRRIVMGGAMIALVPAIALASVVGVLLSSPGSAVVASAVALVVIGLTSPTRAHDTAKVAVAQPATSANEVPVVHAATSRRRTTALTLSALAVVFGSVGLAYAFAGSSWSPWAADSTEAMRHGMGILFVAFPLAIAAFGVLATQHPDRSSWESFRPYAAIIAATSTLAVGWVVFGNSPSVALPITLAIAGALGVTAVSLWIVRALPLQGRRRVLVALAAGIAVVISGGLAGAFVGVFASPVLGVIAAALALRQGKRPTSAEMRAPLPVT